ncbi:ATP-binding protein [Streptomyces brasiliensis]|uniref:ATPase n=1 Tax=Streptomyces brasiliensis TaxID=1954 RepID=A0A917P2J1_9ACTN|nr:ATP-binding protein [Streptomyces brasiliensis]GGJ56395.1 ATPase [Streptomyces brasiliensis]
MSDVESGTRVSPAARPSAVAYGPTVKCRRMYAEDGSEVRCRMLPRETASVPVARQFVREAVTDWELAGLAADVALVVTELTANAAVHACAEAIQVTVRLLTAGRVRVAVTDRSRQMPALKAVGADAVDGRGLTLVDSVCLDWGVDRFPWGKRVWAELEVPRVA